MTATLQPPVKAAPKARRDRRWLRVVIPFTVLFLLVVGTLIVHAIEQPDPEDADFLSPVSAADIGSDQLAGRLRDRGVVVVRETTTVAALSALRGTPATLFVTTPELADLVQLSRSGAVPGGTRIVVVAPSAAAIATTDWPIHVGGERWTTGVTGPGCADPVAVAAGPAAVTRLRYDTPVSSASCYDGALIRFVWGGAAVTVVGAADPFRNDRIGEHGNGALAVGLLAETPRVVWLDVHRKEVLPTPSSSPTAERSRTPDAVPDSQEPRESSSAGDPRDTAPRERPQSQSAPNPLGQAFPPAFWAGLVLLLLALLALAIAAARRLGAPVAEPLPSRVPANETMLGHARLYQRAQARDESLDILRAAARRRIVAHLGLAPGASLEEIADSAGYDVADVREILADFHPENDAELVSAAHAVQNLVREITGFEGDQS
ncbi:DUF4350 domain-containing protein [Actinoplanes sp. L3-i22]|uniref:DUF4350 domain-containing protein n=1 Tax=Actinoplanes sp. L3-i22 TaxID=2836373 RepID=UPI001C759562|nr:DUF4350 domain-containing protein [Actinoplanes sp. L3-i22]BCY10472.1 membrane protein [Actinoplanes sp. L3-i22]